MPWDNKRDHSKNSLTKESLHQNEKVLGDIIRKLKQEDISYRMMEKILGTNRKKLKKIAEL